MTLAPPPQVAAVAQALRWRRLQLAQAVLTQAGTVVLHGPLKGLDMGADALRQARPVARLLGLEQQAWLQHVQRLTWRQTVLLHLGATDAHLACGLVAAGLVAGARVQPADAEAASRIAVDIARHGLGAQVQVQALRGGADDTSADAHWLAAQAHVLCVAEALAVAQPWLQALPAAAWQRCTLLWPAEADAAEPDALANALGTGHTRQRLQAPAPDFAQDGLQGLPPDDRALLLGDLGPDAWHCAQPVTLPPRRRTLLCTLQGNKWVARLLHSLRLDEFEAFEVDVLAYSNPLEPDAGTRAADPLPPGVRSFRLQTQDGPRGVREVDPQAPVLDAQGSTAGTLDSFVDGYEQVVVWSIDIGNAGLLQWLAATRGRERFSVVISDNEIDLRWRVLGMAASQDEAAGQALLARYHPPALEQAYDSVRHVHMARLPWEAMLRLQRRADLVVHPVLAPIRNDLAPLRPVQRPADRYVLMFHPKPSLQRDAFLAQVQAFLARWQLPQPLLVLALRNDVASGPLPDAASGARAELRAWPVPLPEHIYFELMAGCHGLVLVPRGGMTSTRDAVRMGLDILDDGSDFSPNRVTLRDELGLHLQPVGPMCQLHGGQLNTPRQRADNHRRLVDYEAAGVQALRRAILADPR